MKWRRERKFRRQSKPELFGADFPFVTMQNGHAAFQAKPRPARVTGIEKQDPANYFTKRLVRVAEDDGIRTLAGDAVFDSVGGRARIYDVMHEKFSRGQFDDFRFLER